MSVPVVVVRPVGCLEYVIQCNRHAPTQQYIRGIPMVGDDVEIRVLREDDLGFVDELVQQAGWNQLRVDWLRVLRYEPNGCFAAFSSERLTGTVTTTIYGKDLAWIGMMLEAIREETA